MDQLAEQPAVGHQLGLCSRLTQPLDCNLLVPTGCTAHSCLQKAFLFSKGKKGKGEISVPWITLQNTNLTEVPNVWQSKLLISKGAGASVTSPHSTLKDYTVFSVCTQCTQQRLWRGQEGGKAYHACWLQPGLWRTS